ncbi:MAG: cell wall hydrolase [Candidatus Limivicinus sp.]|nr:cell wall hydrolase [Clostridiales bacterium]MDY3859586.1 cell wall hydrolase [Candidatus Limivicinus sp.]
MHERGRRIRLCLSLLLCLLLCGCGGPAYPVSTAVADAPPVSLPLREEPPWPSVPVYIDSLLSARALERDGCVYVPVSALCFVFGLDSDWHVDGGSLSLSVSGIQVTGTSGDGYLKADGRYLYAPDGWVSHNGELYLPLDAAAHLFGFSGELTGDPQRLDISSAGVSVISGGDMYYELNFPADDIYWLSHIINSEAKFEPLAGQIGVGNVVLNRLASPEFPDTVFEVVYDTEHTVQFEPISTGGIYQDPSEQSTIAAYLCLEGFNTVGDSIYFVNPDYGSAWFDSALEPTVSIGHHNFYR